MRSIICPEYRKQGVYIILNLVTGSFYLGSTRVSFYTRWAAHKYKLNSNKHNNVKLQQDWLSYGAQSFEFRIIETISELDSIYDAEQDFLDMFFGDKACYNATPSALGLYSPRRKKKTKSFNSVGRPAIIPQIIDRVIELNSMGYSLRKNANIISKELGRSVNYCTIRNALKSKNINTSN